MATLRILIRRAGDAHWWSIFGGTFRGDGVALTKELHHQLIAITKKNVVCVLPEWWDQ